MDHIIHIRVSAGLKDNLATVARYRYTVQQQRPPEDGEPRMAKDDLSDYVRWLIYKDMAEVETEIQNRRR